MVVLLSLPNRTAGRRGRQNACAWQTWQGYYLGVMSWSSLDINAFWSFTKRSVQRRVDFGGRVFQTKLFSRLSHKVCGFPSSPILLRKFTVNAYELDYEIVLGHESWHSSPCNHLMANKRRDSVPETLPQCSSIQPRPSLTLNLKMANCHSLDVMLVNLYCLFTEHYRDVWGPQFPSAILQSMQKVFGYQATPGQNLPWPQNVSKQ